MIWTHNDLAEMINSRIRRRKLKQINQTIGDVCRGQNKTQCGEEKRTDWLIKCGCIVFNQQFQITQAKQIFFCQATKNTHEQEDLASQNNPQSQLSSTYNWKTFLLDIPCSYAPNLALHQQLHLGWSIPPVLVMFSQFCVGESDTWPRDLPHNI